MKHVNVTERVYEPRRLREAWQQVRRNAGAAGIANDGRCVWPTERWCIGHRTAIFTCIIHGHLLSGLGFPITLMGSSIGAGPKDSLKNNFTRAHMIMQVSPLSPFALVTRVTAFAMSRKRDYPKSPRWTIRPFLNVGVAIGIGIYKRACGASIPIPKDPSATIRVPLN